MNNSPNGKYIFILTDNSKKVNWPRLWSCLLWLVCHQYDTVTIDANTAITTTTISSSTIVNPVFLFK